MNETANSKRLLSDYAVGRDNNFNLMRFVAASAVVVSHSYAVTRGANSFSPLREFIGMDLGNISVDVFFVTSGFLVTGSLLKRNLKDFVRARIARVYPAYVLAILFCVCVIGASVSTLPLQDYFAHSQTHRFAMKNLLLLAGTSFSLPGVFESLPVDGVVNGSLWTLPWEGRLYVVLAALSLATFWLHRDGSVNTRLKQLICVCGVTLLSAQLVNNHWGLLPVKGLRVSSMFFAGSILYLIRTRIVMTASLCLLLFGFLLVATVDRSVFNFAYTLLFPYLVLGLAFLPSGSVRSFNQAGDYSYGIYIYSFPIQQVLVGKFGVTDPLVMLGTSLPIVLLLAVFSWHLVEKRFLEVRKVSQVTCPRDPKIATAVTASSVSRAE